MQKLSKTEQFKKQKTFFERAKQILKEREGIDISPQAEKKIKREIEEEEIIEIIWVKKCFPKREWKNFYIHDSSYCKLKEDSTGVWVGFCIVGKKPDNCYPLDEMELLQVDDYRKAHHIYPKPCTNGQNTTR